MINAVAGKIETTQLGKTLMHEHIQFGYPGYQGDITIGGWDRQKALDNIKRSMDIAKSHGIETIVDATPNECGRDAAFLKEVSELHEVNVICSTGFYYEAEGGSAYFKFRSAFSDIIAEVEEMMVKEITEGIGGTGIKAGVIKLASSKDLITDYEKVFFTAGARAAIETGVPIITHTQEGTMGPAQAALLLELGVSPDKIMIGHMDGNQSIEYQKKTLDQGVRVSFDRCGIQGFIGMPTDEQRVELFSGLIHDGYAGRLHLSHDFIFNSLGRPIPESPEVLKLLERYYVGNIFDHILPGLHAKGVTEEQTHQIMVDNPKAIFD